MIPTPDQRVRVFASSTLRELAAERQAVRDAINRLHLVPVMFEQGARPHSPRQVYRDYLAQSQIFIGVYWQSYGWIAPGQQISGLEDEFLLSAGMPRLIYVKSPAPKREPRLEQMLASIMGDGTVSFTEFSDAAQLQLLVENDLAVLLSERFGPTTSGGGPTIAAPLAGALPAPATPLIDRARERAAVENLIFRHGARLITLTGPGGVGKSRLALEAAARLEGKFRDGVRFIDLAAVHDAGAVGAAIAAGLGLSTSAGRQKADLASYLGSRRMLLVLDNFEQVTEAAPMVAELLAAAGGLVVLTTSRAVLKVRGEQEYPVGPLQLPPGGADFDASSVLSYASVRLFVERARAIDPDFELTTANTRAVAQICRRLDGLPLAIELAAARIRMLPPAALLARLDAGLTVLTGGPRDLPQRQRTLSNTLDWSYSLLSSQEQALFARLGVFAGTFGLPAVAAICADGTQDADEQTIDTLSALVDSSLVQPLTDGDEPRFSMLETVRQYSREHLRASGEWEQVHDRHAAHFLRISRPTEPELHGGQQLAWLDRLEIRHDNLSAAVSWLIDSGRPGPAGRLLWATWRFWWLHGYIGELARLMDKLLANAGGLSPHQHARALAGTGFTLFVGGDPGRAQSLLEQSLPLYRQSGDVLGAALVSAALGHLQAAQGEDAQASQLLERTLSQLMEADSADLVPQLRTLHLFNLALVSNFLGQIRLGDGDYQRAGQLFNDGLAIARRAGDRFTILISLYDLALTRQACRDQLGAAALLRDGVCLAMESGDKSSAAYYLEALSQVASAQDRPERAVVLLSAAEALLEVGGSGWLHAYVPRTRPDDSALAELCTRAGASACHQAEAEGRSLAAAGSTNALMTAL
jgi:predicted ATPase